MSRLATDRHISSELIFRALHDLQAPARHVRSFLLLFRESTDDSSLTAESREFLEAASRAADELLDQIAAIRSALSVPTSIGQTERVDLATLIHRAWKATSEKYSGVDDEPQLVVEGDAQIESDQRLLVD